MRDTQQGVRQDRPPHVQRLPLKEVNDATFSGPTIPPLHPSCCVWEERQTRKERERERVSDRNSAAGTWMQSGEVKPS